MAQIHDMDALSAEIQALCAASWGRACAWCHRTLLADNQPGMAISDQDWPHYASHGLCVECKAQKRFS